MLIYKSEYMQDEQTEQINQQQLQLQENNILQQNNIEPREKKYFGRYYCYSDKDGKKIIDSMEKNFKQELSISNVEDIKNIKDIKNINFPKPQQNTIHVVPITIEKYQWILLKITINEGVDEYKIYNPLSEKDLSASNVKDLQQNLELNCKEKQDNKCLYSDTGVMVFSYIQDLSENKNHTSEQNSIPPKGDKDSRLYEMMIVEKRQIFRKYIKEASHGKSEGILIRKEGKKEAESMLNNEYKKRRFNDIAEILEGSHTCVAFAEYDNELLFAANGVNTKNASNKFFEEINNTIKHIIKNDFEPVYLESIVKAAISSSKGAYDFVQDTFDKVKDQKLEKIYTGTPYSVDNSQIRELISEAATERITRSLRHKISKIHRKDVGDKKYKEVDLTVFNKDNKKVITKYEGGIVNERSKIITKAVKNKIHAELQIVSEILTQEFQKKQQQAEPKSIPIAVSKPCCPDCYCLIKAINKNNNLGLTFEVPGVHRTRKMKEGKPTWQFPYFNILVEKIKETEGKINEKKGEIKNVSKDGRVDLLKEISELQKQLDSLQLLKKNNSKIEEQIKLLKNSLLTPEEEAKYRCSQLITCCQKEHEKNVELILNEESITKNIDPIQSQSSIPNDNMQEKNKKIPENLEQELDNLLESQGSELNFKKNDSENNSNLERKSSHLQSEDEEQEQTNINKKIHIKQNEFSDIKKLQSPQTGGTSRKKLIKTSEKWQEKLEKLEKQAALIKSALNNEQDTDSQGKIEIEFSDLNSEHLKRSDKKQLAGNQQLGTQQQQPRMKIKYNFRETLLQGLSEEDRNKAKEICVSFEDPKKIASTQEKLERHMIDNHINGINSNTNHSINSGVNQKHQPQFMPEKNHSIDHKANIDLLIDDINKGKITKNTVILLERKEDGKNMGIKDVKALTEIIKYNDLHPESQIKIPESIKNSNMYKDAELYKIAEEKGILVLGMEGVLTSKFGDKEYNAERETHMAKIMKQALDQGYNIVAPIGKAHVNNIKQQFDIMQNTANPAKYRTNIAECSPCTNLQLKQNLVS